MTQRSRSVRRGLGATLAAALLAVSAYVVWAVNKDYTLLARTEIEGTPREVWDVLADRPSYPEWNPFMVAATGELREGGKITNDLRDIDGSPMVVDPVVLVVRPGEELRWKGTLWFNGVFDGEHWFRITDLGGGRSLLEQGETFSGAGVPPLSGALRSRFEPQFQAMNDALADEVGRRR